MAQEPTVSSESKKPIVDIPKIIRKKSKDDIELTEEQAKYLDSIPLPEEYKKKSLYCRIWNEKGTRTVRKPVKVQYGKPFFTASVGGKKRLFKIIYNIEGMIQHIDGKMYYNITYDNTLGGLALSNKEFPEDMASNEAYDTFIYNAVQMYIKKGGIPLLYLLIAMIMVLVMAVAIIATVPSGMQAQDRVKDLDSQITVLKQQNTVLNQQLATLQSRGTP